MVPGARLRFLSRFLLPMIALVAIIAWGPGSTRSSSQIGMDGPRAVPGSCPGEPVAGGPLATGTYQYVDVPEAVINGSPWGGARWAAGERSYWHCHASGQLMMVWEGTGKVQRRGERAQILAEGETHYVRPWEEHWHGASPHSHAQYLQVSFEPTGTLWMEEVEQADYLGNGLGMITREEYVRTGVRETPRR